MPQRQAWHKHPAWRRRLPIARFAVAALASLLFALRSAGSLQLLRSAYAVGAPGLSNLRPWMTLRYVATTWGTPQAAPIARGPARRHSARHRSELDGKAAKAGWWAAFGDRLLAAVAGSLVAQGQLSGQGAAAVAMAACVVGDVAGYALGRWASEPFIGRWGRWLGYAPVRHARVAALVDRYDAPTVLLTRTSCRTWPGCCWRWPG